MQIDYHNHSKLKLVLKRNTCQSVNQLFLNGRKNQEIARNQVKKIKENSSSGTTETETK